VTEAAVAALRAGDARYVAPQGLAELREAVAADLASRGVACDAARVLVTPSAKTAVFYAMLASVGPGDEVSSPTRASRSTRRWPASPGACRSATRTTGQRARRRRRGRARHAAHAGAGAQLAGNPAGGALGEAALGRLAELADRHDLVVVTDDIYSRLVYEGGRAPSVAAHPLAAARTLLVDGFSKTYAMTGTGSATSSRRRRGRSG
jgi:aspartate aminotransferase